MRISICPMTCDRQRAATLITSFITSLTSCLTAASRKKCLNPNNASVARCASSLMKYPAATEATLQFEGWAFPTSYGFLGSWASPYHVLTRSPPTLVLLNWTEACMGTAQCDSPEKPNFWRLRFPPDLAVNSFCSCGASRAGGVVSISVLPQPFFASHTFVIYSHLFRYIIQEKQFHLHLSAGDSCATAWEVTSFDDVSSQCQYVCVHSAGLPDKVFRKTAWMCLYQLKARPFTSHFKRQSWI